MGLFGFENKPAFCGNFKCFFYDSKNSDNGYLIIRDSTAGASSDKALDIAVAGWEKAKELELRKYHIRHLFLDLPFEVHLPHDIMVDRMNANSYHVKNVVNGRLVKGTKPKKYHFHHNTPAIIIQPNKSAPTQSIIYSNAKAFKKLNHWETMTSFKILNHEQAMTIKKASLNSYNQNFHLQLNTLVEKEPFLTYDFQLMIDSNGNIYHLDFRSIVEYMPIPQTKKGQKHYQLSEEDEQLRWREIS
ncbi:hypothetical protein FRACYDRAFT_257891 [Fragilariopsis cylindrus CCMP1102]|uniref:Uncharacterized protein n=1 Tax=Fragilariopsis cylindrus CCMP1102 TaxID=635003 RepID=A0A1E7EIW6_9STRA|nr:hypothetical protein FRACYDRAFT_257891 [Fragilariopsis cylindrus CCMP1102]|eukprot:OEU05838.1 hypothetical protein FRACYDRAFT_257891 [Fragilariopsis cylindrus CCMP1102]